MEVADVRKRVLATIDKAKRAAAAKRALSDAASRDFQPFLDGIAIPLFRQVAAALKAESRPFQVFTPGGSVRLMSEKSAEDYIELSLDTSGAAPIVLGRSSRNRGNRVIENERPVGSGSIADLDEEQVLDYLLSELEPFVER
jgi:hypothetical protein